MKQIATRRARQRDLEPGLCSARRPNAHKSHFRDHDFTIGIIHEGPAARRRADRCLGLTKFGGEQSADLATCPPIAICGTSLGLMEVS
jgi:hypothetical protein